MPSSLKKFLFDDLFFEIGLLLSIFITITKLSYSPVFAGIMGGAFVFFSLIFVLSFRGVKFFKRNMARTLSVLLLIASAIIAFLTPVLDSVFIDDDMAIAILKPESRFYKLFGVEREVFGFVTISVILDSFIISIRFLSARRVKNLYGMLFDKILCIKSKNYKVFSSIVTIVPLLLVASLFIFYGQFFETKYPFIFSIIFAVLSLVILAKNPITFREQGRLDVFMAEKERFDSSDIVLERIKGRITKRWVDKYNLPFVEECIMFIVRFWFSLRMKGLENIKHDSLPSVFVANHGEIIGPICGTSYLPVVFRPYVHDHMCDVEKSTERMWRFTFSKIFGFMGEERGKRIAHFVAKHITGWINSYEPVHSFISEGDPRKSMQSMHDGLDSLMDGDSILIFPEDTGKNDGNRYLAGSTGELFSGFAHIGKLYYDKLRRDLYFYPVFINKRKKTLTIGEPVIFDSRENVVVEKKRVASELQRRMNEFV